MALDAFMAYVGVYSSVDAAKADKVEEQQLEADTEEIQKDAGAGS